MDLLHLRMLHSSGYAIASNRVSLSVLDMRAAKPGGLAEWCATHGVGLFAHGVLVGGFIDDKWLGQSEPHVDAHSSLGEHKRRIDLAGEFVRLEQCWERGPRTRLASCGTRGIDAVVLGRT